VDVGEVMEVGDGIALVSGLQGAMAGELVEFTKNGTLGIVLNLNRRSMLVSSSWVITPTLKKVTLCAAPGALLQVPVGDALIGRVINAVGQPIDGKGPIAHR
jgi:F-type H+-transporting ATPase subunit alpha